MNGLIQFVARAPGPNRRGLDKILSRTTVGFPAFLDKNRFPLLHNNIVVPVGGRGNPLLPSKRRTNGSSGRSALKGFCVDGVL
jgi:hypothetical protein